MLRTKPITPRRTKPIVPIGPIVIAPDEATSPGETRLAHRAKPIEPSEAGAQTKPGSAPERSQPRARAKPIEPSEVIASKGVGCCHENKATAFRILPNSPIFLDLRVPQGGMTNCVENFSGWALGFDSMTFGLFPEHKSTLVVRGSPRARRTRTATACGLISLARAFRGLAPTTRWSLLRGGPLAPGRSQAAWPVRQLIQVRGPMLQQFGDQHPLRRFRGATGRGPSGSVVGVEGSGAGGGSSPGGRGRGRGPRPRRRGEGCGVAQGRGEAWQVGHGHGVQVEQTRSTGNSVGGFEASLTVREGHQHFDVLSGSAQGSTRTLWSCRESRFSRRDGRRSPRRGQPAGGAR